MRTRRLTSWIPAALALLVAALSGCGPGEISEEQASTYVDKWAEQAERSLEDQVAASGATPRFEKMAEKAADKASGDVGRKHPPYDALVRDAYESTDWKLRFASRDGLTERGQSVWDVVSNADRHALDTESFEFDAVEKHLERVRKLSGKIDDISAYEPSESEKKRAREWLTGKKTSEFDLESDNFERLAQALAETDAGDRLKERMAKIEDLYVDRANSIAKLELLLARNTARYLRKIKHFRVRHLFIHEREDDYWRDPVTEGERPDKAKGPYVAGIIRRRAAHIADKMKEPTEILHRRIRKTLKRTLTEDEPAKVLRELEPQNPQYAALKKAYEKYRSIVRDGGWEEVSEDRHLDPGDTDETVAALKERLQIEGFYPSDAPVDKSYGDDLKAAVESYQETHQMKVTGEPHDSFWSSLNKSAEWRKGQVGLNLQRWRASDVRHSDPMYVLVNIPGAHLEIWENQKRAMRFRVVVGNNKSDYDKEKKETVHPNRTPQVSAYIDRVIYNPYWNITDRIRNTEILPKVRKSVEQKYKEKLKELRRKKRRLKRSVASADGPSVGSMAQQGESALDRLLVAQSSEGGGSGVDSASESSTESPPKQLSGSEDETADEASESSETTDGASGDDGSENSGEGSEDTDGASAASSGDSSGESTSEESVKIDDLYRMVEDEKSRVEEVDMKTVFEVEKIRKLIEETEKLSSKEGDGGGGASQKKEVAEGSESSTEGSDGSGEGEKESEEEPKTPLEKKFPYLDPKTGVVDVSTTDPDNVPAWYQNNDHEVMFPGKDWEYVRMKQGRANALGRVKVIFPNRHDIYLHDTPKKQLFKRNIRAFSHGCMRMNKPLSFAEYLLKQDGSFSEVDVDKLLNEKKRVKAEDDPNKKWKWKYEYRPVFLDKEIPVYVEYFTTRVDEEGRTQFFADVYEKDKRALESDESDDDG